MIWLLVPATVLAILHYFVVSRRRGIFSADGLFVLTQWLMVAGTLPQLQSGFDLDERYSLIITIPMLVYTTTSIIIALLSRHRALDFLPNVSVKPTRPSLPVVALFVFSAVVTIGYYSAVGYNVFLVGLRNLSSGSSSDIATLRNDSYAGTSYFAPGYVNQFKNVILPFLTIVLGHYMIAKKRPLRKSFIVVAGVLSLIALVGTGQRGAFVVFGGAVAATAYQANRVAFRRWVPLLVVGSLSVLTTSTLILGRGSEEIAKASSTSGKLLALLGQVFGRFFHVNQESGRFAFWYTSQLPIQHGREWLADLSGISPTSRGSDLANRIYASVYGTRQGTEPPSMWGSVHFNFGWVGLIVVPVILAIAFHWVTVKLNARPPVGLLDLVGRCGVQVVLGTWIMGGPSYLLNNGIVAYLLLMMVGRWASSLSSPPAAEEAVTTLAESPQMLVRHRGHAQTVNRV